MPIGYRREAQKIVNAKERLRGSKYIAVSVDAAIEKRTAHVRDRGKVRRDTARADVLVLYWRFMASLGAFQALFCVLP